MKQKLIITAAFFGATSVVLGALGAHTLTDLISAKSLAAFEKGVKYQLFHALLLLFLAISVNKDNEKYIKPIALLLILGICFFSFSIYLLSTQSITAINFSFLGPITPLGGIGMISSWILLALNAKKIFPS